MHARHIAALQSSPSASQARRSTSERTERTERPEKPEQPEAPEQAESRAALSREDLKNQIRDNIIAAQEAAQEASVQAREAENQVRIANGQLPLPAKVTTAHTIQGPFFGDNFIPPQAVDIAQGFFAMCAIMVVGWPLARAFGRRLEKGGGQPAVSPAMTDQLQRIEQAVDAMSIEIERISESQRFLAKLQSQQADPVALPASDRR